LIFTDLDGTLLNHATYTFQLALPALKTLKEKNIPLIFCTSKTRAETEKIRKQTENTHPYIIENGGAIFIPEGDLLLESDLIKELTEDIQKNSGHRIIEMGIPYSRLREVLSQIQTRHPGKIKGFGDLTVKEVANLCDISSDQALLAKHREYDEPFILEDEDLLRELQEIAQHEGLRVTRGGRFYHLMGANDKGQAVLRLIKMYRQKFDTLRSVALGDSLNDLPMLATVDIPVLLPKPDGFHDPSVLLDGLFFAKNSGPSGWNDAVLKIIHGS
jgi:mannosyl-3-phosphoglycerate phosphatase